MALAALVDHLDRRWPRKNEPVDPECRRPGRRMAPASKFWKFELTLAPTTTAITRIANAVARQKLAAPAQAPAFQDRLSIHGLASDPAALNSGTSGPGHGDASASQLIEFVCGLTRSRREVSTSRQFPRWASRGGTVERCGGHAAVSASVLGMQPAEPRQPTDGRAVSPFPMLPHCCHRRPAGERRPRHADDGAVLEIKAANPDCLLFYRMGDFYELFFDDALVASRALGITLTKRGKHLGDDIPMCGVPVHAADDYLQKLIALGHPRGSLRADGRPSGGAEARRQVGCASRRDPPRHARHHHRGAAARCAPQQLPRCAGARSQAAPDLGRHALAWIDISTGEFRILEVPPGGLAAALSRIEPRELVVLDRLAEEAAVRELARCRSGVDAAPAAFFDAAHAEARLSSLLVSTPWSRSGVSPVPSSPRAQR